MAQINIVDLLQPVAQHARQCPEATLIRNYNRAVRQFCNLTRILLRNAVGVTVAATPQYTIGNDPLEEVIGIRGMSYTDAQNKQQPITERAAALWDINADQDAPSFYQYQPHGQFVLGPTPDKVYNLKITVVAQPKLGAVSIDQMLAVDWEETFIAGTLYRLMRLPGLPWTNITESNNQHILFMAGVASGCSSVASSHNAGAAQTDSDGPPSARQRGRIQRI